MSAELEALTNALEEIAEQAFGGRSALQPGAAFALGVLADLAGAGPGSSWSWVARRLMTVDCGGCDLPSCEICGGPPDVADGMPL